MKEKTMIRRTSKTGLARITIPQKLFDETELSTDTEYFCSLDTTDMILFFHPEKMIGNMPMGKYKIYAGGTTQSPSIGIPRQYADMFFGFSPAAWISANKATKMMQIEMVYKFGKRP